MYATNESGLRARWEVLWREDGETVSLDCGDDFHRALGEYVKAKTEERPSATLRCKNQAFPPPAKLRERHIEFDKPRKINGRKVTEVHLIPMRKLNREGWWWCPYCIKLIKFEHRSVWHTETGHEIQDPAMCCPLCDARHDDFWVSKFNPQAQVIGAAPKVLSDEGKQARRKRRKRKREANAEED